MYAAKADESASKRQRRTQHKNKPRIHQITTHYNKYYQYTIQAGVCITTGVTTGVTTIGVTIGVTTTGVTTIGVTAIGVGVSQGDDTSRVPKPSASGIIARK